MADHLLGWAREHKVDEFQGGRLRRPVGYEKERPDQPVSFLLDILEAGFDTIEPYGFYPFVNQAK